MDGFIPLSTDDLTTPAGIARLNTMLSSLFLNAPGDGTTVSDFIGQGSPEGVVTAGIGATYRQTDGTTGTTFYVKQTGIGNTGWVPMTSPPTLPLSVANGGTGADFSSQAIGSIFVFNGTGTIAALTPGTTGQALVSSGTSGVPAWGTVITPYAAGTTLLAAANTTDVTGVGDTSNHKVKSIVVVRPGTISTSFDISTTGAVTCHGRIYRNGSPVGTDRTTTLPTFVTFTEDIAGWSQGDTCELWIQETNAGQIMSARNFQLFASIPTVETVILN